MLLYLVVHIIYWQDSSILKEQKTGDTFNWCLITIWSHGHFTSLLLFGDRLDSLSSPPASAGLFSPHSPATGSQSDPWQHGVPAASPKGRRRRVKELRTSRAEQWWRKRMKDGRHYGQTETNHLCSLKQEEPTVGSHWPCGLYVVTSQMAVIFKLWCHWPGLYVWLGEAVTDWHTEQLKLQLNFAPSSLSNSFSAGHVTKGNERIVKGIDLINQDQSVTHLSYP